MVCHTEPWTEACLSKESSRKASLATACQRAGTYKTKTWQVGGWTIYLLLSIMSNMVYPEAIPWLAPLGHFTWTTPIIASRDADRRTTLLWSPARWSLVKDLTTRVRDSGPAHSRLGLQNRRALRKQWLHIGQPACAMWTNVGRLYLPSQTPAPEFADSSPTVSCDTKPLPCRGERNSCRQRSHAS